MQTPYERPGHEAPASPQDVSPIPSWLHHTSCSVVEASASRHRPSSVTARIAILLTLCFKALWKQPTERTATQPEGSGSASRPGKPDQSPSQETPTEACPSGSRIKSLRTKAAVPGLGQELPRCACSQGAQFGVKGSPFPARVCGFPCQGLIRFVMLWKSWREEVNSWCHHIDFGFLDQRLLRDHPPFYSGRF